MVLAQLNMTTNWCSLAVLLSTNYKLNIGFSNSISSDSLQAHICIEMIDGLPNYLQYLSKAFSLTPCLHWKDPKLKVPIFLVFVSVELSFLCFANFLLIEHIIITYWICFMYFSLLSWTHDKCLNEHDNDIYRKHITSYAKLVNIGKE